MFLLRGGAGGGQAAREGERESTPIWRQIIAGKTLGLQAELTKAVVRTKLSAAIYAAYGFTGAFRRKKCKFTFPQRRRNLRKFLPVRGCLGGEV